MTPPTTSRELRIETLLLRMSIGGRSSAAAQKELDELLTDEEKEQIQWLSTRTGERSSDHSK